MVTTTTKHAAKGGTKPGSASAGAGNGTRRPRPTASGAAERASMASVTDQKRSGKAPKDAASSSEKHAKAAADGADKGRLQALERALGHIEKTFGSGSIMRLDSSNTPVIPGIATGALSLDIALGGRGVPRGRVVEIFGPESSGKTTLALSVAACAQKTGGIAAFIDAEHALDPSWAKRIGVNLDELLVSQPDTGEQALEICELLVRSNAVDVVVVDSVAALIPRAEIEGEMGDSHVGLQARLMSQAMRKLTGAIAKSDTIVIFINQLREKIGVMFGSPETTPGGRALKFYSSVRIDIRRTGAIKDGDRNIGNHVRARVVKNKIAPPFREAEFDIMFDEGISTSGDLLDLAVEDEIIKKSGAWFSYGEIRVGQGRENAKLFLRENADLFDEIREAVRVKRGLVPGDAEGPPVQGSEIEPKPDEAR
jgi:recombination protein RecA